MKWKDLSLKERKQIYDSVRVNNPGATYFDIKEQFDSIPEYEDGKDNSVAAVYSLPEVNVYPQNRFGDIARSQGYETAKNWQAVKNATTAGINEFANDPRTQFVLAALPIPSGVEDLSDVMKIMKPASKSKQLFYHGSPVNFDKFDPQFIGSAEGGSKAMKGINLWHGSPKSAPKFANIKSPDAPIHLGVSSKPLGGELNPTVYNVIGENLNLYKSESKRIKGLLQLLTLKRSLKDSGKITNWSTPVDENMILEYMRNPTSNKMVKNQYDLYRNKNEYIDRLNKLIPMEILMPLGGAGFVGHELNKE